jgi:hypothetical protein
MRGRALALSLVVYVTLDLANPFMPGAVTFVEGRLEVIDAGRPTSIDLPLPGRPTAETLTVGEVARAGLAQPPDADGPSPRRWMIPSRRVVAPGPDPGPSPEDH